MRPNKYTGALSALALTLAATAPASAQQPLEEIVVTATKRAESLQDVPMSILAFDGPSMRENGVTKMEDLTQNMPAVTVAQNPIGNAIFIRGIGSSANQGIEQSVAIFQDGIFLGRHQLSRAPFMDLERIEVVRGPQSIMFGKNTIGGALSVITAKPTDEFEGNASVLVGEYGEQELNLVLSGPITDGLAGRLAVRNYQHDGYMKNVMNGADEPGRDDWTARGTLRWDATDSLTVTAKYERNEFEQDGSLVQLGILNPLTPGATATNGLNAALVAIAGGAPETYDDERAVINDGGELLGLAVPSLAGLPGFPALAEGSDNKMDTAALTIDWDIDGYTVTSVTGYAGYDYRDICDCDFAALPLIQVDATEDYEQISQEIRLTSPGGETLDYIVGLYYHKADLYYTSDESFGTALLDPAAPPPNVTRSYYLDQEQEQWAVFGSFTYSLTDLTRATVGLRYTTEDKTANRQLYKRFTDGWDFGALGTFGSTAAEYDRFEEITEAVLGGDPLDPGLWQGALGTWEHVFMDRERSEDFFSWSVSLEHDLNDEIMVYGLVSTGVKGGGFDARYLKNPNLDPAVVPGADRFEYEEENAINYELGMKSTLFGGAMNFNATLFRTEVEDLQVSIFDGATAFLVDNAAEVRAQGLEAELNWAATDNLTVALAFSFLDNEFVEFTNSPCWASEAVADPVGCLDGKDVSGQPSMFSPDFSANLKLDHYLPLGSSLELHSTLNVNYSDGYFNASDLDPEIAYQDSWTKFDLRFALRPMSDTWEIALLGKNLTDEKTSGNSNDQPLVPGNGFAQLDRLRSVSVQASLRF
ncbi:MAG: TonB-dependent receptor [Gammaproteobacteria bacterium]